jgi:hypothetical protein
MGRTQKPHGIEDGYTSTNIISLTAGQPERLVYEGDGLTQRCGMLPPMIDEHNICAVRCTRPVNVILHPHKYNG